MNYRHTNFKEGESYTCKRALEHDRNTYTVGIKYKIVYYSSMSSTYKVVGDNGCLNFSLDDMVKYFYLNDTEVMIARKHKIRSFLTENKTSAHS